MFEWLKRKEKKNNEPKQNYASLLEHLARENNKDLVWLLLGSLISADTLISKETCENSIQMLGSLSEAINRVPEGLYTQEEIEIIKKHCFDGIEICKRDLEAFERDEETPGE